MGVHFVKSTGQHVEISNEISSHAVYAPGPEEHVAAKVTGRKSRARGQLDQGLRLASR